MENTKATKPAKEYSLNVRYSRRTLPDREKVVTGTLEYLQSYFSYTLLKGNCYKKSIPLTGGKTIKSFVTNLQKAYEICEAACYDRTYVNLV